MRRVGFGLVMILLVVVSCTKKAAPVKVVDGAVVYKDNCQRCHGVTGTGERGPDLTQIDYGKKEVTEAIFYGGGKMPSFGDKITSKEISAVADFVLHLKK